MKYNVYLDFKHQIICILADSDLDSCKQVVERLEYFIDLFIKDNCLFNTFYMNCYITNENAELIYSRNSKK